jgi:hypothetical protein
VKLLVDMNLCQAGSTGSCDTGSRLSTGPPSVRRLRRTTSTSRQSSPRTLGRRLAVVQIRTQDLLSEEVVSTVVHALEAHRDYIERGALLSIDEAATRVRVLPLR